VSPPLLSPSHTLPHSYTQSLTLNHGVDGL
jgi:hypothetical protein